MKKPAQLLHRFDVQITTFFLLAALLVITWIAALVYYSVSRLLIDESIAATKNVLEMSSMNIETYIGQTKAEASVFAEDTALRSYLEKKTESTEAIRAHIHSLLQHDSYLRSVIIVSKDGRILTNEQDMGMTTSSDMMQEEWYKKAIHTTMPVLTGARMQSFSSDMQDLVISTSTEIKDEKGENLGVLLLDMKYDVIAHFLQAIDMGRDGSVFIINGKQQLVYHKNPAYLQNHTQQKKLLQLLDKGNRYDEKENLLIHQTRIAHTDWSLAAVLPMQSLTMLKQQLFEHLLIIILIIAFIVLLFGSYFLRRLSSPMKKLQTAMLEIERLSEIQVPDKSYYEVEVITDTYNQMIRKIKELMRSLSDNEKRLKEAEISALISQINPHFLYNTLDTIIWMAEFNDYKRVISLTKSLAAFFRLSLANGKELVTLQDELEHTRQYLLIQQERYGEKLSFTMDIEASVRNCIIPKIIVQPLVENSIYHGIKNLSTNGHIVIKAYAKEDDLFLSVEDNGVGFAYDQERTGVRLGGVGLQNVEQRIKLYYGDAYGVHIQSEPGKGSIVTLHLSRHIKQDRTADTSSSQ